MFPMRCIKLVSYKMDSFAFLKPAPHEDRKTRAFPEVEEMQTTDVPSTARAMCLVTCYLPVLANLLFETTRMYFYNNSPSQFGTPLESLLIIYNLLLMYV